MSPTSAATTLPLPQNSSHSCHHHHRTSTSTPSWRLLPSLTVLLASLSTFLLLFSSTITTTTTTSPSHTQPHRHLKHQPSSSSSSPMTGFITRKTDRLYLNNEPFRFVSFNAPNLHVAEDDTWHRITVWEQEDALQTISRMGGRVARIYPMSVAGGMTNGTYTHILGKGKYNEALFRDLDRLLAAAAKHDVRVIIPFIDHWEWWGGIKQFAHLYDVKFSDFYRKKEVVEGFKDFVKFLVMRTNTQTGRLYRDDPAIMAWESGNELDYDEVDQDLPTREEMDIWMADLATYIKGMDPNHLVMDGRLLKNRDVSDVSLTHPDIDLITDHFYPNTAYSFDERMTHMLSFTKGHKPFVIGEFGLVVPITVDALLQRVNDEPSIAGALLWSLRSHSYQGGFYWHYEYDNYWAYHYPGFASNAIGGEKEIMSLMERHAYTIQGLLVPHTITPGQPELIEGSNTQAIAWRGAVGAEYYELERQEVGVPVGVRDSGVTVKKEGKEEEKEKGSVSVSAKKEKKEEGKKGKGASVNVEKGDKQEEEQGGGGWTKIPAQLLDSTNPYLPFKDETAHPGKAYRYRIYAVNNAGRGTPSTILTIPAPPTPAPTFSQPHTHTHTHEKPKEQQPVGVSVPVSVPVRAPPPPPKEEQVMQQGQAWERQEQQQQQQAQIDTHTHTQTQTQPQPAAAVAVKKKKEGAAQTKKTPQQEEKKADA